MVDSANLHNGNMAVTGIIGRAWYNVSKLLTREADCAHGSEVSHTMHAIPMARSKRAERTACLVSQEWDLVIIGGGITGAGIAREASLAGLRVALLEARDFASGTSSRSTKLFHGGLRYLERAEFLLVREGGREREGMQRLAPHLVHPLPFLLPIYKSMKYGKFAMGTAVWLYDRLAQVEPGEQRVVLTADEVLAREPGTNPQDLTGGVMYHEYLTDDARCTVTVLRAAEQWGALSLNYTPVTGLLYDSGRVCGVTAKDAETGESMTVRARVVVNAAGPWIESVLGWDDREARRETEERILHSRGVHIVFDHARLPISHAFAIQTPDGRLLFIIPREDRTFVGTTDETFAGDLYHPEIVERDVEYLLDLVNAIFPAAKVVKQDVVGQWSGVRPLVLEPGKASKDVSRKDQVWISDSRLVTIAGGKLTAWRKMAEDVMETVYTLLADLGQPVNASLRERAETLSPISPLPGGLSIPPKGLSDWIEQEASRLVGLGPIAQQDAQMIARRYGDEALAVMQFGQGEATRIVADVPLLHCELAYLVEREMAVHLSDVIVRRTGLGWFGGRQAVAGIVRIAEAMAELCDWTEEQRADEVSACLEESYWGERSLYNALDSLQSVAAGGGL